MEISIKKLCDFFKCYDTNVERIFLNSTAQYHLRKMGFHSDVFNYKTYLRMIPMMMFYHIVGIGQLGHLIHYLKHNPFNFFEVADDFAIIVTTLVIDVIVVIFGSYVPELTKLFNELGTFDDPIRGRPPYVEALSQLFTKYVNACAIIFSASTALTFIYYFMNYCEPDEVSCGFMFTPYLPYIDIYNKPWRQIFLLFQCISAYSAGHLILIQQSQYILALEMLILNYEHLGNLIKLMPTTDPMARRALLRRIVQYHNFLLRMGAVINRATNKAFTVHLTFSPMAMSIILYQLIGKGVTLPSIVHLGSYILIITITCASGERLTTNAEKLHDVIFYAIPFDDVIIAKDMQLMLLQAKKPMVLRAGSVSQMNHLVMNEIYRTVWARLTLILETS